MRNPNTRFDDRADLAAWSALCTETANVAQRLLSRSATPSGAAYRVPKQSGSPITHHPSRCRTHGPNSSYDESCKTSRRERPTRSHNIRPADVAKEKKHECSSDRKASRPRFDRGILTGRSNGTAVALSAWSRRRLRKRHLLYREWFGVHCRRSLKARQVLQERRSLRHAVDDDLHGRRRLILYSITCSSNPSVSPLRSWRVSPDVWRL